MTIKRTGGPPGPPVTDDSPPPSGKVTLRVAPGTDAAGELDAWAAAVVHLHHAGLPAAVPAFPAAWLRRRGIRPDWVSAA